MFNYSAAFGFIWEELTLPIAFDAGIEVASTTQDITVRRDVDGEES